MILRFWGCGLDDTAEVLQSVHTSFSSWTGVHWLRAMTVESLVMSENHKSAWK